MTREELAARAKDFFKRYQAFMEEAQALNMIGFDKYRFNVHMPDNEFFDLFQREECEMSYHSEMFPTRYSMTVDGVDFFCLTSEPWKEIPVVESSQLDKGGE